MDHENHSAVLEHDKTFLQYKSIVYYVLGIIEVLLAFRFIFKLLGANPNSGFVSFIYGVTSAFLLPFTGIFGTARANMDGTQAILEPATLVGMVIYAVIAWGIIKLIEIARINKLRG